MKLDEFRVLKGKPLSIVRRVVDMLVLHFGDVRPHSSGDGTVGDYAFHIQCPWRFEGPAGIVTGRDDLWDYAGPGERPRRWSHEDGFSLQDLRWAEYFVRDGETESWVDPTGRFVVDRADQSNHGDVTLSFSGGYRLMVFPAGSRGEAWRFFAPGADEHLVFPAEG